MGYQSQLYFRRSRQRSLFESGLSDSRTGWVLAQVTKRYQGECPGKLALMQALYAWSSTLNFVCSCQVTAPTKRPGIGEEAGGVNHPSGTSMSQSTLSWLKQKKERKTWELSTEIKTIEQRCFPSPPQQINISLFLCLLCVFSTCLHFHLSFISWEDTACCPMTAPLSGNLFF